MTNPYVENLVEMGYDRQDCNVASAMFQSHAFPCVIYGRHYESQEEYFAELHEYFNGL